MIASRSMAGLTGNPHVDEGFLLRIHAGDMTSGALFEPIPFCRLIGIIGFPLPLEYVVAGGKDDKVISFFCVGFFIGEISIR